MIFTAEKNALLASRGGETLRIEGWGKDSFRVRAVMFGEWTGNDWALTEKPDETESTVRIWTEEEPNGDGTSRQVPCAEIRNGRIRETVNFAGVISFY